MEQETERHELDRATDDGMPERARGWLGAQVEQAKLERAELPRWMHGVDHGNGFDGTTTENVTEDSNAQD